MRWQRQLWKAFDKALAGNQSGYAALLDGRLDRFRRGGVVEVDRNSVSQWHRQIDQGASDRRWEQQADHFRIVESCFELLGEGQSAAKGFAVAELFAAAVTERLAGPVAARGSEEQFAQGTAARFLVFEVLESQFSDRLLYIRRLAVSRQGVTEINRDRVGEAGRQLAERFAVSVAEDTPPGTADMNRDNRVLGAFEDRLQATLELMQHAVAGNHPLGEDADQVAIVQCLT